MKKVMWSIVLVVLLNLAGCAGAPRYMPPTDATAPKLTLVNLSGQSTVVQGFADAAECKTPVNLSVDHPFYLDITKTPGELRLHPNKPFSFLISMRPFLRDCFLVATVLPRSNTEYKGYINFSQNTCSLRIVRVEDAVEVSDPAFIPRKHSWGFSACADKLNLDNASTP